MLGHMSAPESFLPAHGPDGFADLGPWAGRGRRIQDPDNGGTRVAIPAPYCPAPGQEPDAVAGEDAARAAWERLVERSRAVRSDRVALPQAVVQETDRTWLLYDVVPERSFAQDVARLGGAVQGEVLGMVADVAEAIGELHDHGLTLRRMSLRDVLDTGQGWQVLVSPDSGIRTMAPGREVRDAQGDLAMLAAAAATVLTGRRPSPERSRARLSVTCPALPQQALDVLDDLLDDVPGARARHEHRNASAHRVGEVQGPVVGDRATGEQALGDRALGDWAREIADVIRGTLAGDPAEDLGRVPAVEPADADTETLPRTAAQGPRDSTDDVLDLLRSGRVSATRGQSGVRPAQRVRAAHRPWDSAELMVDEDNVPPPQTPRYARSRRPRAAVLAVVVVVALVVVGALVFRTRGGLTGPEAGTETGTAVVADAAPEGSSPVSPSTTSASGSAAEALPELVAARGEALRSADADLLGGIYTDGAEDLAADRSTVDGLQINPDTGEHAFSSLAMAVEGEPSVASETEDTATVDATVTAEGLGPGQADSQDVSVDMVRTGQGWRIQDVQPR